MKTQCVITGCLISVLLIFASFCHGAGGPRDFSYASSEKSNIFFDEFTDNRHDWAVGTFGGGKRKATLERGYYQWESLKTGENPLTWKNIHIDTAHDYEIEVKIKYVRGEDNNSNTLCWGMNTDLHRYRFGISGNGQYIIDQYDGKWTTLVPWTKSGLIKRNNYNLLTVRKVGDSWYFFINRSHIHTLPVRSPFGSRVGFQANQNTAIRIDSLKVSYLRLPREAGYNYYSQQDKSSVLMEGFDDNRNNWAVGTFGGGVRRARLQYGYYQWESLKTGQNPSTWISVPINTTRDFEIETFVKYVRGEDNNANCLLWGMNDQQHRYRFGISGNGQYIIDKYEGAWTSFVPWTETPLIKRAGYNKITVRKIGQVYYLFLNERFIHSMPFWPFYGTRVGFQVNQNTIIQVDSLRVSYLQKIYTNNPPQIVFFEPSLERGIKIVTAPSVKIRGQAVDPDGIYEVRVNGIPAVVTQDGTFSAEVPLGIGNSQVTIQATDNKMKSSFKTVSVSRKAPAPVIKPPAGGETRLALLIGNAAYKHGGSLANPVNDARAMESALRRLGFSVLTYENCTQKELKRAMDGFGKKLKNHDVGLFFYAGHGIQVNGNNYLIPTDAKLVEQNDAEYDCVRADRILAKMEAAGSRTNIVILDACRDNPFERSWHRGAKGSGLAFMNAPSGSLIAYATSPGNTASDGIGKNGIYTAALLNHIDTPDITILQMFQRVRSSVLEKSGNKQTPWESTSLQGDFYFSR